MKKIGQRAGVMPSGVEASSLAAGGDTSTPLGMTKRAGVKLPFEFFLSTKEFSQ